ncbi:MAG TPA: sialate O-acetylesterase [Prolixibacteraceae bacterium]|nr:sialate O-acetylesterase [Prolixibacteraceae bacterium]HPS11693.1 sialate O-acetylesterase [Prolixibacteraceae bacterium]
MKHPGIKSSLILSIIFIISVTIASGEVRLPRLVSDGMVLQRETPVRIWGWANPGEKVTIGFNKQTFETEASNKGEWQIMLPAQKAGGPYEMKISASNQISLKNILFGEVWLCSGQSNMELPMRRVAVIYPDEIASSKNPFIRQFVVPVRWNYNKAMDDISNGEWKEANPENVLQFSAAGYFFARSLYEKYKIPVGIILCAAGGSAAESWLSEKTLMKFPEQYKIAKQLADSTYLKNLISLETKASGEWFNQLGKSDLGRKEIPWFAPQLDDSNWSTLQIPSTFNEAGISLKNGAVWFRKEINLPENCDGKTALLEMGRIVDSDSAFINGQFVGNITYQYPPRRYQIAPGILKAGKNIITVRVVSQSSAGEFVKDKPYQLTVEGKTFDIKGSWKYQIGATMPPCPPLTYFPNRPLGLYNAMLHPMINYTINGVIWYQGETNAERPNDYSNVLTALINEWRTLWKKKDLPFLCVQLPNFQETKPEPTESNWAILRNEQLKILSVPNTSLIVTLDLGEWNDIHPLRKKEVGERLALAAENKVYGEKNVLCSGPVYQKMKKDGNRIVLSFTHCGSGLLSKNGELKEFAIAGADKKYVWAKAKIEGNNVVVWNENVPTPVSVRYAWADNPKGANLYNKEGLPASPFCTLK